MIFGDGDVLNEVSYSHHAQTLAASRICMNSPKPNPVPAPPIQPDKEQHA